MPVVTARKKMFLGVGGAASDGNVGEGLNCLPGPRAYSNLLREGPRR